MNQCNLTKEDYIDGNIWVGKGNSNCTDPQQLRNQITIDLEDLRIQRITIETFDQEFFRKYPNDSSLQWSRVLLNYQTVCFTVTLPKELIKLGIYEVSFEFDNYPELEAYVHQQGKECQNNLNTESSPKQ